MSKTSRIILWCALIVVLAMCIVLYIAAKRPAADTTYCDAGKTYAESLRPGGHHGRGFHDHSAHV